VSVDLDAIRARAQAATPAPWHPCDDGALLVGDYRPHPWTSADVVFCALARADVPALCDEVERLRRELLRATVRNIQVRR
jgi:hypothetical protein